MKGRIRFPLVVAFPAPPALCFPVAVFKEQVAITKRIIGELKA